MISSFFGVNFLFLDKQDEWTGKTQIISELSVTLSRNYAVVQAKGVIELF